MSWQPSSDLSMATSWLYGDLAVPQFPHLSSGDDGKCSSHQAVVADLNVLGIYQRNMKKREGTSRRGRCACLARWQ